MHSRGGHGCVGSKDCYVGLKREREQKLLLSLQHRFVKVVLQWIAPKV